jgi:hypothetical protein
MACLVASLCSSGQQSPSVSSSRSACDIASAEHVAVCTNEQPQNVLPSAAPKTCATPQSPDRASVAIHVCLLMQVSSQPCTRPVSISLAVSDLSAAS